VSDRNAIHCDQFRQMNSSEMEPANSHPGQRGARSRTPDRDQFHRCRPRTEACDQGRQDTIVGSKLESTALWELRGLRRRTLNLRIEMPPDP